MRTASELWCELRVEAACRQRPLRLPSRRYSASAACRWAKGSGDGSDRPGRCSWHVAWPMTQRMLWCMALVQQDSPEGQASLLSWGRCKRPAFSGAAWAAPSPGGVLRLVPRCLRSSSQGPVTPMTRSRPTLPQEPAGPAAVARDAGRRHAGGCPAGRCALQGALNSCAVRFASSIWRVLRGRAYERVLRGRSYERVHRLFRGRSSVVRAVACCPRMLHRASHACRLRRACAAQPNDVPNLMATAAACRRPGRPWAAVSGRSCPATWREWAQLPGRACLRQAWSTRLRRTDWS